MQFDFFAQYQGWSNTELLKIVNSAGDYEPSAVEAANEILKNRTIEESERLEVAEYFAELNSQEERKRQKREKLHGFFRIILEPGNKELNPLKWYYGLLIFVGLQCIASLYRSIPLFIYFIHCIFCSLSDFTFSGRFFELFLIVTIFSFLAAKLKIGWMLLFADVLLAVAFQTVELFQYVFNSVDLPAGILWFTIFNALRIAMLWYLRNKHITSFFGVTTETERQTLIYSCALALIAVSALLVLS